MKHMRAVNSLRPSGPTAGKTISDMCLIDYSSCSTSDVCWLLDMDNGFDTKDNCIVDVQ